MAVTEREFEKAQARAQEEREGGYVLSARYNRRRQRVIVELSTGIEVTFSPILAEGLAGASPENLAYIEVSPSGTGLYWPQLDADLYVPALLQGVFGSRSWMAAHLGTIGGRSRSEAKATAARKNGRKGGRPRQIASGMSEPPASTKLPRSAAVVRKVRRLIDLDSAELGAEFFPAHLSVALIDAILTARLRYEAQVVPLVDRYCRFFGLRRLRTDRSSLPLPRDQETLQDLINHYETYGVRGMEEEIFGARYRSPGTDIPKVENIRRAAVELRKIGLENLQDAASRDSGEIECVLRPLKGIGARTIHMFLMYAGNENYVKGDVHIRRFVADALDRKGVSAAEAEQIVQEAAGVLGVAPRHLDYAIWQYASGARRIETSS